MAEVKKIIYSEDNYDVDYVGQKIKTNIKIDKNYKFISKNIFYKFFAFICYRLIATPIAFFYCKIFRKIKYVNKKCLKLCKDTGYFVYANHTNQMSDAFSPHMITFPRKAYTVVNAANLCIPFMGRVTKTLGAIPVPTHLDGTRNFMNALEKRILQGSPVVIYPEAHLWPYFTGVRPYVSTSFRYPVKFREASYCFTTTYQQGKSKKYPKVVVYVDGPFYPNADLSEKEQQEKLHDEIYDCMKMRSQNSNFQYIVYEKKGENND